MKKNRILIFAIVMSLALFVPTYAAFANPDAYANTDANANAETVDQDAARPFWFCVNKDRPYCMRDGRFADDGTRPFRGMCYWGSGFNYGGQGYECPRGCFVDADGNGICDNWEERQQDGTRMGGKGGFGRHYGWNR